MGDSGVDAIPTSSSLAAEENLQCTICLSANFSQECRVDGCNHSFCFYCISEWICQSTRPSCPMCRCEVVNLLYNIAEHATGLKKIEVNEYRSGHVALSPTDRIQLLSERRVVVRNLMQSYKVAGLLSSNIAEINESTEPDEALKIALIELADVVSKHIKETEEILLTLRTENARKNKSLVFDTLPFRRMIYSKKVKIRYQDNKKKKRLEPVDLSKNPERFRGVITEFLMDEFDAIPFANQPKLVDHKWRTKFLGENIDTNQKQQYASRIYDLMLVSPTGKQEFQTEMNKILTPVSLDHIKCLDEHLEAIITIEKTNRSAFYQEVFYDSIYNSYSHSFFDFHDMMGLQNDPQRRFEALFSQIHRELNPTEWLEGFPRIHMRRTATASMNVESDSDSDEERAATPIPDGPGGSRAHRAHQLIIRFEQGIERRDRVFREEPGPSNTTRTLPINEQQSTTHMTLRSSRRRAEESSTTAERVRIPPRRPSQQVSERVREFDNQSHGLARMFRFSSSDRNQTTSGRFEGVVPLRATISSEMPIPVYNMMPRENDPFSRIRFIARRPFGIEARESATGAHDTPSTSSQGNSEIAEEGTRNMREMPSLTFQLVVSSSGPIAQEEEVIQPPQQQQQPEEEEASVAQRTRSARRARNEQSSEGPPAKRPANSRRDRR